jgi:hypothetical protein
MRRRTKLVAVATAALAVIGTGVGVGVAAGGDDDAPLRGATYERAKAAALQHAGGGSVIESERSDDGAAYEVGIRRADGSQIEVELSDRFEVVGTEGDEEGAEAPEANDD